MPESGHFFFWSSNFLVFVDNSTIFPSNRSQNTHANSKKRNEVFTGIVRSENNVKRYGYIHRDSSKMKQENKMPTRCNRGFYCRSYCLLNIFRASLCPSSGAQEYYTVVAACGISCFKNVKNNFLSFCGIFVLSLKCRVFFNWPSVTHTIHDTKQSQ